MTARADNQGITRSILALAVPSILANITTPLLGLVDTAIVGHMGSAVFIAAIALGGTCFSMIYWIFSFLRMGTGGVTAQAVGASDTASRDAALWRSLALAMLLGLMLIALRSPLRSGLLAFLDSDPSTTLFAARYFDILIFGAPATLGLYVANGWFIGVQNTRLALYTSLVINIVNIATSLILVYLLNLGIDGVAAGTLTAQWIGFLMAMWLARRYHPKFCKFKALFARDKIKSFFSLNFDIFLRTLCLVAVTVWFTRAGASRGDVILAANALLMQLFLLFSYVMDGYAFAGEALAGRYTGSGDRLMLRRTIKTLFIHGSVMALLFTAVYAGAGDLILSILSNDESVIAASGEFRWWAVTIPFAGMGAFIWDGIFVGETRTRQMLLSMAAAMGVFFLTWWILQPSMGNHGLWLAFVLYLFTRGALQTVLYLGKKSFR